MLNQTYRPHFTEIGRGWFSGGKANLFLLVESVVKNEKD
jgi:hypothetical protein